MFVLIAVLLTLFALAQFWLITRLRGLMVAKVVLPVITVFFTCSLYFVIPNVMGFPTEHNLPKSGTILAVDIKQPTPDFKGAVYVLVSGKKENYRFTLDPRDVFRYTNPNGDPRLYVLPYTTENQKTFQQVKDRMKKGQKVELVDGDVEDGEGEPGDGKGQTGVKGKEGGKGKSPFKFLGGAKIIFKEMNEEFQK